METDMKEFTQRARALVAQMTLVEKVSQMLFSSPAIPRLGIKAYNWWNEALHGVARAGVATVFPQAIGLAAMYDTDLLKRVADVISTEARAKYQAYGKKGDRGIYKGLTFWSPNINIFRDQRWGRGQETYGEDPVLTAECGKAFVKGLQGEHPCYLKASACAKHFAVHSGPEGKRHYFNASVNSKDLRETYLYAFEELVKAGVSGVMGAYNAVNGEPCCGSHALLLDILRKEWGFEGYVTSDCWALRDFHEGHHVTAGATESVALAVKSSCDLNCGDLYLYLLDALDEDRITEKDIDECVTRLMTIRLRLGTIDDAGYLPFSNIPYERVSCPQHRLLAREAAENAMVLLENRTGILPLNPQKLKTLAVIGPNADSRQALIGNYYGTAAEYVTALQGIRSYLEGYNVMVRFAAGSHLYLEKTEGLAASGDRLSEAVLEAERADVVVLCLGLDETLEGEENDASNLGGSGDKEDLLLPKPQRELLDRVLKTGTPTVVVLFSGSALAVEDPRIAALVWAGYPGEQGGAALARILFGEANPSGKLPITFYRRAEDQPDFEDYAMRERTYRYFSGEPLYPFGYGLSYTTFSCSDLCVDKQGVSVTVTNTGMVRGREIIQVYIAPPAGEKNQPRWSLKAFHSVSLNAGEEKRLHIPLAEDVFLLYDENGNRYKADGEYTLYVGNGQPTAETLHESINPCGKGGYV